MTPSTNLVSVAQHLLLTHDPIARWTDLSGGNDHTLVHAFRIGTGYLMLTSGGGADAEVRRCGTFIELTSLLAEESRRGEPEDGWSLDLYTLNHLVDMTLPGTTPDALIEQLDDINVWAEIS